MARLPRDPDEAAELLGVEQGTTVIAVGPDHGYADAFVRAVGDGGKVIVSSAPPDEDAAEGAEVVDELAEGAAADTVIGWVSVVPVHAARALGGHVREGGSLWLVLPKTDREERAPVTEGELKRAMLAGGWKEERVVALSTDSFAVRFRKRR